MAVHRTGCAGMRRSLVSYSRFRFAVLGLRIEAVDDVLNVAVGLEFRQKVLERGGNISDRLASGPRGVLNRSMPPPSMIRILQFAGLLLYVPMMVERVVRSPRACRVLA